jgi:hypothetical protein
LELQGAVFHRGALAQGFKLGDFGPQIFNFFFYGVFFRVKGIHGPFSTVF